jgi:hypothetical protein
MSMRVLMILRSFAVMSIIGVLPVPRASPPLPTQPHHVAGVGVLLHYRSPWGV